MLIIRCVLCASLPSSGYDQFDHNKNNQRPLRILNLIMSSHDHRFFFDLKKALRRSTPNQFQQRIFFKVQAQPTITHTQIYVHKGQHHSKIQLFSSHTCKHTLPYIQTSNAFVAHTHSIDTQRTRRVYVYTYLLTLCGSCAAISFGLILLLFVCDGFPLLLQFAVGLFVSFGPPNMQTLCHIIIVIIVIVIAITNIIIIFSRTLHMYNYNLKNDARIEQNANK